MNPCPQCGNATAAEELFCPHCGAATIPQASRTQLQRMIDAEVSSEVRGGRKGMLLGFLGGMALAAGYLAVAGVPLGDLDALAVIAMRAVLIPLGALALGGGVGAGLGILRRWRQRAR